MSHSVKSRSVYTKNNRIEIVRGGAPYFDLLLEMIDRAKYSIHID
jgi:hypothetical protein